MNKLLGFGSLVLLNSNRSTEIYQYNSNKVMKITKSTDFEKLQTQLRTAITAGKQKIGPRVYQTTSGIKNVGKLHYVYITMKNMDFTLDEYIKNPRLLKMSHECVIKTVSRLINDYNSSFKCRNNLELSDVMYNKASRRWYIVDYSQCHTIHPLNNKQKRRSMQ